MPSLDGCWRKIERAQEQFEALAPEVRSVEEIAAAAARSGHSLKTRFVKRQSVFIVKFIASKDVDPAWGVIVGEILYNLRCALEYLVHELSALDRGTYNADSQFPISDTRDGFLSAANGEQLAGISNGNKTRIERHQPYESVLDIEQIDFGGRKPTTSEAMDFFLSNLPLRTLRQLSNRDKHRLLVDGFIASRDLTLNPICIRNCKEPRLLNFVDPPLVHAADIAVFQAKVTGEDPEMKVEFRVPPVVALPEAPAGLIQTIDAIAAKVIQIVREFQPAF
jgi:hypothetical protein